jgi:hypothetical protein
LEKKGICYGSSPIDKANALHDDCILMRASLHLFTLLLLFALRADAVPPTLNYAGQVAVNGQAFDGQGLFKFALVNADGNASHWSNDGTSAEGSEPQNSVSVTVNGGLYSILLGNFAIPGMSALDPAIFQQHPNLRLRVWFNDGENGFQQLSPDRAFASVPYALTAGDVSDSSISLNRLSPEVLGALNILPSISTQPFARYDRRTDTAIIEAHGRGYNLSYQWLKDGEAITGAITPVLELSNPVLDDNATFSVRLTNSVGQTTSQTVTLKQAIGAPGITIEEANASTLPRQGLVLWLDSQDLDADGITDNLTEGSLIQIWNDKSGNDRNATQSSTSNQPQTDNSFGQNIPTVRFSGGQWLTIDESNVSVAEYYLVFSASPNNLSGMTLLWRSQSNHGRVSIRGNQLWQYTFGSPPTLNGFNKSGLEAYNQLHILKLIPSSQSDDICHDISLGAFNSGVNPLVGNLAEVLLYERRLEDFESTNLIQHLKNKWSVPASTQPDSSEGLLLHWKFEPETDSNSAVFDHSGNGFGANALFDEDRFVDGVNGKGYFFDGDDYISDIPGLGNASSMSVWINPESDLTKGESGMAILTLGPVTNSKRISCGLEGGILFRAYKGVGGNYLEVNSSSAIGYKMGWSHLVVVIPDTQNYADIYLNGIKQSTNKVGNGFKDFNFNEAIIGKHVGHSNFHGAMDELKFYSHPLSEAEIQVLYHSTFSPILRMAPEHNATLGSNLSLSLAADNSPTTYLAEGLPEGLSLNVSTGQITGMVTQLGYHRVFVKAMNEHGTGSDTIAIVARPQTDQHGWPVDIPDGSDIPQNGMVLWLDANDVDADGEFDTGTDHMKLTNWADKAGKDHNATQATVTNQPEIRSGQIAEKNTLKLLHFDGNQSMHFPIIQEGRTFFWVINRNSENHRFANFMGYEHSDENWNWGRNLDGAIFEHAFDNIKLGLQKRNGEILDLTIAGTFLLTPQIISLRTTDFVASNSLGKRANYETFDFQGNIGEILVYDRALTENEIETVEKYLGQKWGISISHDANPSPSGNPPTYQLIPANDSVTTAHLTEQILKYLKPEITSHPQPRNVYSDSNHTFLVTAEGKYLAYQWKKNGADLPGETNSTFFLTDANATLHDGNYSVVVSNDFGSVESGDILLDVNTSLLDGLVGWWKFDETNGTVAYDSSGNGNDGNLTNGPIWRTGKIGGALSFDGVDDYVTMGGLTGEAKFHNSVSFWFSANNFNNAEMISKSSPGHGLEILFFNGGLKFYLMSGDISAQTVLSYSTGNLALNQWCYVTAVQFGQGGLPMHLYINSELVGSDVTPETISDANNFYVGRWNGDARLFKGLIDDVRIYDRALSAEEVQALYNLGQ